MSRKIVFNEGGRVLNISKATSLGLIRLKMVLHLDSLHDGTWRLTYNRDIFPDFSLVQAIDIAQIPLTSAKDTQRYTATFVGTDVVIELARISKINFGSQEILHIDEDRNGRWQLFCTQHVIQQIDRFTGMKIVRDNEGEEA